VVYRSGSPRPKGGRFCQNSRLCIRNRMFVPSMTRGQPIEVPSYYGRSRCLPYIMTLTSNGSCSRSMNLSS
jgi:hypothetical protein